MNSAPVIVPFRASRSRRQTVAARLARAGTNGEKFDGTSNWASGLRRALHDLGPLWASLAAYLGSRVDLLRSADCRELSRNYTRSLAWPVARVSRVIGEELGIAAPLVDLSPSPVSATPWSQTHRARLTSGERIHVEVLTLETEAAKADIDLLPLVQHACGTRVREGVLNAAIADFVARFDNRLDCRRRLPLALRAADAIEYGGPFMVPVPRPDLCSAHVFVTELPEDFDDPPSHDLNEEPSPTPDAALATVSAWLRLATSGSVFAVVDPRAARWSRGRLLAGGEFARLPAAWSSSVTTYLLAVAGDLPDRAWSALMHELTPLDTASPPDEVARAFQCLVPFRDDRTCDSGSDVADHAFLQWRAATKHGWIPSGHLVPFYQGLCGMVATVRDSAAGRDVLAEAVRALRVDAGVRQLDEWTQNLNVMSAMERQMSLLLQLPQKLDRLLTVAADGSVRVQLVAANERAAARRSRMVGAVAALLVAAAAIVLAGAVVPWPADVEPARSVGLLVAGGLLVWAVGRVL